MTKQQPLQKAKPIIFDTESVRAILDGRKTAARTVIKLPDGLSGHIVYEFGDKGKPLYLMYAGGIKTPKYQAGDILYVRETWCTDEDMVDVFEDSLTHGFYYRANEVDQDWVNDKEIVKWHPSVQMPKEATRIFLRVTDVRVERLQDITEEQAIKEGAIFTDFGLQHSKYKMSLDGGKTYYSAKPNQPNGWHFGNVNSFDQCLLTAKSAFLNHWNSKIPKKDLDKYGWNANPYVFVYEYKRVEVEE